MTDDDSDEGRELLAHQGWADRAYNQYAKHYRSAEELLAAETILEIVARDGVIEIGRFKGLCEDLVESIAEENYYTLDVGAGVPLVKRRAHWAEMRESKDTGYNFYIKHAEQTLDLLLRGLGGQLPW